MADYEFRKGTCDDCTHEPEPMHCKTCMACVAASTDENKFPNWEQGNQVCMEDMTYDVESDIKEMPDIILGAFLRKIAMDNDSK